MAANMAAAVADSKSVLNEMKSLKEARAGKLSVQQQKGREACDEIQQRVSDARGKVSVVEAQIKAGKEAKTQLDHERRSLKDSLRKYTRNTEAMSRKTEQHEQACLEAQNRVKEFESKKSVETLRQSKTEVRAWDVRLKNKEEQVKDRLRLLLKHQSTVEQLSNEKNTLTSELASLKDLSLIHI